jgi:hypothetical protein
MFYLLPMEMTGSAVQLLLGMFAAVTAVGSYLIVGRP